jgi:hypothetical protein
MAILVATAGAAGAAEPAAAEAEDPSDAARLDRIEATVRVVAEEIDSLRKIFAVPEDSELVSVHGLGPAASKVYTRDRGLSIGGYGEVLFSGQVGDRDGSSNVFDALRAVIYAGYKFNDWIVYNSEFEFEHGGTGAGGSVSTEFLTLDFLFCECLNVRAGLLLVPMGFVNEIHEPVFFYGATRPEVEQRIIPSTWRENGVGIFGTLGERVEYRFYAINGFDGSGFSDAGLRGGRQNGGRALADHFAFVGRVDVDPIDGVTLGASVYTGKSGQNQQLELEPEMDVFVDVPDTMTTIWEIHGQVKLWGAHFRGLFTQAHLGDTAELSAALALIDPKTGTVAKRMRGGYAEFAYDVLPMIFPSTEMSLEPFYRFEHVDTQNRVAAGLSRNGKQDFNSHTVGLQFKPHPQVVIKLDYRHKKARTSQLPDKVQASIGFVF